MRGPQPQQFTAVGNHLKTPITFTHSHAQHPSEGWHAASHCSSHYPGGRLLHRQAILAFSPARPAALLFLRLLRLQRRFRHARGIL